MSSFTGAGARGWGCTAGGGGSDQTGVECIMANSHMGPPPHTHGQIDMTEKHIFSSPSY